MNRNILFIGNVCSSKIFQFILNTSKEKGGNAIQKFGGLLLNGFVTDKNNFVETMTSVPVAFNSHEKRFWLLEPDFENEVKFRYIPMINLPVVRHIFIFSFSFFRTLIWQSHNPQKNKVVICDVLAASATIGALLACKLRRIKVIGLVTDIPGIGVAKESLLTNIANKIMNYFLFKYDAYVILTEQMNKIINPFGKLNVVMEGLVDVNMIGSNNELEKKAKERILIYAGGIHEEYGVKKLIEAFRKLEDKDLRLHIYGSGEMEDDMPKYEDLDNRLKYMGIVPNDSVVKAEIEATLLINPRSSREEYTLYSFPSKNLEYMVSGTPVVSTPLQGMPLEYYKFVYIFEDESEDGICKTLKLLLDKPRSELHDFGIAAKSFVLMNKNNVIQSNKILQFSDEI